HPPRSSASAFFSSMSLRPPSPPIFPYTTLFRSGLAEVVREAYPDHFAWDERSPYHAPRSTEDDPVWYMVDVGFVERFPEPLPLPDRKSTRLNSSHVKISYAVFCLKKKKHSRFSF